MEPMLRETKQWLEIAEKDYQSGTYLLEKRFYPQSIYLFCQALEKVLKAAQIEYTKTIPKKIHHLHLIAQTTGLEFSKEQIKSLEELSKHYGRVRYPDISQVFYNTKTKTASIITNAKQLYLWIYKQLKNQ